MNRRDRRRASSWLTSRRFSWRPEPTGHSTLKLLPRWAYWLTSARMSMSCIGIQIGPRQLELPPNIPLSESSGTITDPILLSANVEDIGVLGVIARQRANPIGAQELVLVEHVAEYPAELVRVDKGKDPAAARSHLQRNRESRRRIRVLF